MTAEQIESHLESLEAAFDLADQRAIEAKAAYEKALAVHIEAIDAREAAWKQLMKASAAKVTP